MISITGWTKSTPALLLGLLLPLLAACDQDSGQGAQSAGAPPPAVVVSPVTQREVSRSLEFVGRSVAFQRVDIRARVTGFLEERPFKEGAKVETGDLLYSIQREEFEAAVSAAEAQVARAEAALVEAERSLERSRVLAERQTVSQAALDEAVAKEAGARADLQSAQAVLKNAEIDLGYTRIAAPIAGRIGSTALDSGNLIGPDSGVLATIVATDPIEVRFALTEAEMLNYKKRQADGTSRAYTPRLRLVNGELLEGEGELAYLDNEVDPTTGTAAIFLHFPNPAELVLPGQFVTVLLISEEPEQKVVVPQSAVQTNQAGPFVLVVDGENRVEARPVGLGERSGIDVVVESGLEPGESIVIEGIQKVRPGAQVTPTQASGS
ncbi:MAG: efflux RND transporter periplasmic adaptor subunit [Limibacillus sp.]